MTDKWNWNPATEELEPADKETEAHDLPREEFEASRSGGIIHMRPRRRQSAFRGEVPTFASDERIANLHNLCLRLHLYFAVWRGGSGAVTFLDFFDGPRKVRYECTTDSELEGALIAVTQELRTRLARNGLGGHGRLSSD